MDSIKKRSASDTAPHDPAELPERELPVLETPLGRAADTGASHPGTLLDEELRSINAPAWALNEVASGSESHTEETADGFDEIEEEVRHEAEDIPSGGGREGRPTALPVFEAGLTGPKVSCLSG